MKVRLVFLTDEYPHPIRTTKKWYADARDWWNSVKDRPATRWTLGLAFMIALIAIKWIWLPGGDR